MYKQNKLSPNQTNSVKDVTLIKSIISQETDYFVAGPEMETKMHSICTTRTFLKRIKKTTRLTNTGTTRVDETAE